MAIKKALVTGGCGFLGSHLVDALLAKGVSVYILDKKKIKKEKRIDGVRYKMFDVQSEEAAEYVRKVKPDVLFHLAFHGNDRESVREPVMNAENNVIGTLNLLQAMRENKKGRVVLASSGGVIYGNREDKLPLTEKVVPKPITPFAISKLTVEHYLRFYQKVLGMSTIALRFANLYGPRQDWRSSTGAMGIFAAALLNGEPVTINNDGETTRDYLYVTDAIDALLKAAESEEVGVFNIGTGVETSTNELYALLQQAIGVQAKPDFKEEEIDVVKHNALDSTKAKEQLKWEAKVPIEEGIQLTVDWYREHE